MNEPNRVGIIELHTLPLRHHVYYLQKLLEEFTPSGPLQLLFQDLHLLLIASLFLLVHDLSDRCGDIFELTKVVQDESRPFTA